MSPGVGESDSTSNHDVGQTVPTACFRLGNPESPPKEAE